MSDIIIQPDAVDPDDFPSYNEYLEHVEQVGIPDHNVLSKDDWNDIPSGEHKPHILNFVPPKLIAKDEIKQANKLFNSVPSKNRVQAIADTITMGFENTANTLNAAAEMLNNPTLNSFVTAFTEQSQKSPFHRKVKVSVGPGGPDFSGESSSGRVYYGLEMEVGAAHIKLNTGIIPNTYTSRYHQPANVFTPMHMSCIKMRIPTQGNVSDFFDNVVCFKIQNELQGNVSFGLDLTDISAANLRAAFDALIDALNTYYYMESIIAYCNVPTNFNSGMHNLRDNFSADMLYKWDNIRTLLEGLPIPPNLLTLCYWFNQNYVLGNDDANSIVKIHPDYWTILDSSRLDIIISNLDTYRQQFALISRACPTWVDFPLIPSYPGIVHDPNFSTLWSNLPHNVRPVSTHLLGPSVSSDTDTVAYSSFTNDLDGAVYGLMSVYSVSGSAWKTGFLVPTRVSTNSSRISYTTSGWVVPNSADVSNARGETFVMDFNAATYNSNTPYVHIAIGAQKCEDVKLSSFNESAEKLIEWMMSIDSIGKGAPLAGRRKRGGKPKFSKKRSSKYGKNKHRRDSNEGPEGQVYLNE